MDTAETPIPFELPTLPIPWSMPTAIIMLVILLGITGLGIAVIAHKKKALAGFGILGLSLLLWVLTLYDPSFRAATPLTMPGWMRWTVPTGTFIIGMLVMLVTMTTVDIVAPTEHTKGAILPMPFSRGERLFIAFMIFFGVMVLWMAFWPGLSIWAALATSAALIVAVSVFG